ncbi:MAG: TadE/TadG family type IV pilus assembly protein [Robiginitomaculum sp.]
MGIWLFHKRKPLRGFVFDASGSVAVEAVFVLPFLILLGLGAVDYSNMLLSHHKMQTSVTAAGTYLSRSRTPQNYEAQARNLAVTGKLSGGSAILPSWSVSDITISYQNAQNSNNQYRGQETIKTVKVETRLAYQGFGFVNAITPGAAVMMSDSYEARIMGGGI